MQVGSEQRAVPAEAGGGAGKGARHSMLISLRPTKGRGFSLLVQSRGLCAAERKSEGGIKSMRWGRGTKRG
jgi:hypothetical protein